MAAVGRGAEAASSEDLTGAGASASNMAHSQGPVPQHRGLSTGGSDVPSE